MSRYIMIRRLRGPAYLLLVGALALLNQADILSWGKSWPLFLILAGLLALAERAALASEGGYQPPYPGQSYPGAPAVQTPPPAPTSSAIVPARTEPFHNDSNDSEGGQS
jgi:hypothetical protein